jgi:hypothetical protein
MKLTLINERSNPIKNGIGDDLEESDVDQNELKMGIEVEKEHTADLEICKDIAIDHLKEDPKYYTKLNKAKL